MVKKSLKPISAVLAVVLCVCLLIPTFSQDVFAAEAKSYNESYKGVILPSGKEVRANINFTADFDTLLYASNKQYSRELGKFAEVMAADVYENMQVLIDGKSDIANYNSGDNTSLLKIFGMQDIEETRMGASMFDVDSYDISHYVCSHRQFDVNGKNKEIIFVNIEGTDSTKEQWYSNLDVGSDTQAYYDLTGEHPEWTNKLEHKGFNVASNRVMAGVENYINNYVDKNSEKIILITGHSRGAAIANIIGTKFENDPQYKSFTYTFATPETTIDKNTNYETIFNVVNTQDIVPFVPLPDWGFDRYGTTLNIDMATSSSFRAVVEEQSGESYIPAEYKSFPQEYGVDYFCKEILSFIPDYNKIYSIDKNNELFVFKPYTFIPGFDKTFDSYEAADAERMEKTEILKKYNLDKQSQSEVIKAGENEWTYAIYYSPSAIFCVIAAIAEGGLDQGVPSDLSGILPLQLGMKFLSDGVINAIIEATSSIECGHHQTTYYAASLDVEFPLNASFANIPVTPNEIKDISGEDSLAALNGFNVSLDNSNVELEKLFNITPEEKAQGVNVWIEMKATTGEANFEETSQIESTLKNNTLAQYFEINLYKKVGNNVPLPVATTSGDLKIKFTVPEQFRANSRNFLMMYSHNGGAAKTITPLSYNSENGQLLFASSEFSTYALVYNDFVKTYDQNNILKLSIAMAVACGGVAITIAYRRKTSENN